jgi:hypothetical protein
MGTRCGCSQQVESKQSYHRQKKEERSVYQQKVRISYVYIFSVHLKKMAAAEKMKRSQRKKTMGDYDSKTKHSGGLIEEIDDTAKEEVEQKYRRCTSCGHRSTHNASNCPYDGSPKPSDEIFKGGHSKSKVDNKRDWRNVRDCSFRVGCPVWVAKQK